MKAFKFKTPGFEPIEPMDKVTKELNEYMGKNIPEIHPDEVDNNGCPKCFSKNVKLEKKEGKPSLHKGNRVYTCLNCKSVFASPTTWAYCQKFGDIGKDTISNDCLTCEWAKKEKIDVVELAKIGKMCPQWVERSYKDEK